MNRYTFKIEYEDRTKLWYPPVMAYTYEQALRVIYSNHLVFGAELMSLVKPDGTEITKFGTPGDYDLQVPNDND